MPMDFPDMKSLKVTAEIWKFREPKDDETEDDFRLALHEHIKPHDRIESFEIKFGIGWNQWTDEQKDKALWEV